MIMNEGGGIKRANVYKQMEKTKTKEKQVNKKPEMTERKIEKKS